MITNININNKEKITIDFFEIFKEKYGVEPILTPSNNINYSATIQKFKFDFKNKVALIDENSALAKSFGFKAKKINDIFPQILNIAKYETSLANNIDFYNIKSENSDEDSWDKNPWEDNGENNENFDNFQFEETIPLNKPNKDDSFYEEEPIDSLYNSCISNNNYSNYNIFQLNIIKPIKYNQNQQQSTLENITNTYKFNKSNQNLNYSLENRLNLANNSNYLGNYSNNYQRRVK
jgi:hypothetical protein